MDTPPPVIGKTSSLNSSAKRSLTPCRRVGLGRPSSGSLNKLLQKRTVDTPPNGFVHNAIESRIILPRIAEQLTSNSSSAIRVPLKQSCGLNKETVKARRCLASHLKPNELQSVKEKVFDQELINGVKPNESVKCESLVEDSYGSSKVKKFKPDTLSPISSKDRPKDCEVKYVACSKAESIKTSTDRFVFEKETSEQVITQLVSNILEKNKKLDDLKVREAYARKHNIEELRGQSAKWRAAGQEALRHCVSLATQVGYSVTIPQLMERHGFPPSLMRYNADDDEFE